MQSGTRLIARAALHSVIAYRQSAPEVLSMNAETFDLSM
jgi:hypothetical protein